MYLDRIIAVKRQEVEASKERRSLSSLVDAAEQIPPVRPFHAALAGARGAIIAEIKRRSPSRGTLAPDAQPTEIARIYERYGASAISVLTDATFFGGSGDDLMRVRDAVSLPLLRKDFILDPYQIYESRILGADCILLIADILDEESLAGFIARCAYLGMDCLVEAHEQASLERALNAGATLVGINNRDLKTFQVTITTTLELLPFIPSSVTVVSESGIKDRQDMETLIAAGVHAVLIGETLMTAGDRGTTLRYLLGEENVHDRP